jgi:hypothetical protein
MRASYEFVTGNYQEAARSARKAIELADLHGETSTALESYSILAISMLRQSQLKAAMQIAQSGLALARSLGDRPHEGIILNSMGMIAIEGKDPVSFGLSWKRWGCSRNNEMSWRLVNQPGNVPGRCDEISAARQYRTGHRHRTSMRDRYAEGLA